MGPPNKILLSLTAHPDDAEFLCAGTLALMQQRGWEIHIATMTPGDKGSATHTRAEISRIRREEARSAATVIHAGYHCLDCEDLYILYDRQTINKATTLIREVRPAVVITHSPVDYMVDHEMTSRLARTACFAGGIKNMEADGEPFEPTPRLYYADPIELKDSQGRKISPSFCVDVTSVMEIKTAMLRCHASQREWLLAHHGVDEYLRMMEKSAHERGREINVSAAEGFRQHLGHGFPQDNPIQSELGSLFHPLKSHRMAAIK